MSTRRPVLWVPPRSPLWLPTTHRRNTAANNRLFHDTFGEGGNPLLTAHTPNIGTSWSQTLFGGYSGTLQLISANGTVSPTVTANADGILAIANATYPNDYSVEASILVSGASATYSAGVVARASDTDNYYIGFVFAVNAAADTFIFKVTAGVAAQVGSGVDLDTDLSSATLIRLEVDGTALRFYVADTLQVSTTDSAHTTGQAGMAFGTAIDRNNDAVHANWEFDDFVARPL